jgi:malonate-semialdehyde dehydrogenase (acetylating)/methylmalonate-semialdehyde dehydrogenase
MLVAASKRVQTCSSSRFEITESYLMLHDRGPVISPAAKERVTGLIGSCQEEGGKILLDGRDIKVPGYPDGNFVGPTILEAGTDMRCYK